MDPPRAFHPLFRVARGLRWRRAAWSSSRDQEFHDHAFAGSDYDPFSFSYPGYVTIRRFADLAEPNVPSQGHVLDIGCGPGEITCELARRRPDAQFIGIDHSRTAIDRATRNAVRLHVQNVTFHQASAETFAPAGPIDLVTMFDSFHHVPDPEKFVERLTRLTTTVFLVEPAGNVLGQWKPRIDLDWVLVELDKIRRRAEHQFGVLAVRATKGSAAAPASQPGAAVERRYPIAEYGRLFKGFGLSLQGTIAGFEKYPPDPFAGSPLKEHFGRLVYETVVRAETELIHGKRDLHAKHWAILAKRGEPSHLPSYAEEPHATGEDEAVTGPWDVEYVRYEGTCEGRVSQRIGAIVHLRNRSWRAWNSSGDTPVHLSYHWASRGAVIVKDGLRSSLPGELPPGEERPLVMNVQLPDAPGEWDLQIDLVEEGVTWFSEQGQPPLAVAFTVHR